MAFELPKEAFIALAALGWADGSIRPSEKAGLLKAASSCGVAGGDLAEVEAALTKETKLDGFVPGDMSDWQRLLTYGLAVWLARLDGVQSTDESAVLKELAKRLDLDQQKTDRASAAAFDVFCLPEGGRPDRFDFVALDKRMREKLPHLAPKG
ncbi:MAG: TerB family tellurite resistance protein [Polyangiaceae bacterium]|nr:TerB family tellurite resistance protein [Polyangiaceae bacterium]